jgi:hypothetical protein
LQDAKDTYNAVIGDSRISNPDELNLEGLRDSIDPCVMMGRKYEMAMEELSMLRKDHAGLRREKKESQMWKSMGPDAQSQVSRVDKENDSLRKNVVALQGRLQSHENPAMNPKRSAGVDKAVGKQSSAQAASPTKPRGPGGSSASPRSGRGVSMRVTKGELSFISKLNKSKRGR